MSDSIQLSILIPTLDEERGIVALLGDLERQIGVDLEVIVVDGGSRDDTVEVARRGGAKVLRTGRGRAVQMNRGARCAHWDNLLFLHADSRLKDRHLLARTVGDWQRRIQALGHRRLAGHFALRFQVESGDRGIKYRFLEAKTALNRRHSYHGDQGLLIHRRFFDSLGGFDESLPFLEGHRLGLQIHRRGRWMTLDGVLETSARRFETEGFGSRYLLMGLMVAAMEAEVDEFFEWMPDLYRAQTEAGPLEIREFAVPVAQMLRRIGPQRCAKLAIDVMGLIRDNAWQPLFFARLVAGYLTGRPGRFLDRRILALYRR